MSIDLTSLALEWMATYGAPMVGGLLLVAGLGVPLPATLLVIASGAFIRQELLDLYLTPALGYAGTVMGDVALYGIGYFASGLIQARLAHTSAWQSAQTLFRQRGGWAVFLTRWLITAIALPITLIAGSSRYPFRRYVLLAAAGEFTWLALYGGLGYAFGSQWELINEFISNFSGFILGGLGVGVGVYVFLRGRPKPTVLKPE